MKVLIIEDEVKTGQSLKQGLEEFEYEVDLAFTGEQGLNMALHEHYKLIISDVILPDANGFELCKKIRNQKQNIPILMLTALNSVEEKVNGFESGADDYLVKPFEFKELLVRMKSLLKRSFNPISSNKMLSFYDLELDLEAKIATRDDQEIELTTREFDLLKYFIENQNKVISKKTIAEEVWNIHFETGTNTIEVYINYLRNKIDKPFAKKLIHTIHGSGYILKV